jgi:tight adherence protein C
MIIYLLSASLAGGIFLLLDATLGRKTLLARVTAAPKVTSFWQIELQRYKSRFSSLFEARNRNQRVLHELPETLDIMAVALSAGDSLFAALARVVSHSTGILAGELQRVFLALELGADLEGELDELARRLPSRQVSEFANKLKLALRRGNPLAEMIREQSVSARAEIRNESLRRAGQNETKMLIPLVFLILPVTVLFAIYPSLQLLKISYI